MSLSKREFFDQPIRNVGSEAIPAFAIVEVKSPGLVTFAGREWFTVGKPSKDGKVYFVNGPFPIDPSGTGGAAMPYRAPGVHALFKPDLTPATNQELGPIDGQWYLGEGNGFFVVGDVRGEAASQPGFPASAATKRVRVMTTAVANEVDRIQGTVAMTVSETTIEFPIQDIFVLSGKDPRPEPHSPAQFVIVQNNLQKAYVNGVDRVTATRNKTDGKWYVETVTAAINGLVPFELIENKRYRDEYKLARPIDENGQPVTDEAQQFYVVDAESQFYGRSPQTGQTGYRGMALKFIENYRDDKPGYRIVTMEGPASFLIGTLNADLTGGAVACVYAETPFLFGLPYSGRVPGSDSVLAYDDLGAARGARAGEKWVLKWNEDDERYCFWRRLSPQPTTLILGMVTATIGAATMNGFDVTCAPGITPSAVTKLKWSGAGLVADGSAVHGVNFSKTALRGSTPEPLIVTGEIKLDIPDTPEAFLIHAVYDLRMMPNLIGSTHQAVYHPTNSVVFSLDGEDC